MDITEYEHPDTPEIERKRFVVDNDAKADWALRKLGAIRAKQKEHADIVAREIERLQFWLAEQNRKHEQDAAYFEQLLIIYAAVERQQDRKTIDLPHGKIKSRAVKAKAEVVNVDEFLAWARVSAPDLIRVKESPNVSALNEFIRDEVVVTDDGEVVPSVTIIPASVNYTIETE